MASGKPAPKNDVESGYIGALTHGVLVLVGTLEAFDCRSNFRKFLTGCVVGWHISATVYHLRERWNAKRNQHDG
jgi:hypothetical protein